MAHIPHDHRENKYAAQSSDSLLSVFDTEENTADKTFQLVLQIQLFLSINVLSLALIRERRSRPRRLCLHNHSTINLVLVLALRDLIFSLTIITTHIPRQKL